MKRLSIIVPLHNEEKRLPFCMSKLINFQHTYGTPNCEIILVENGSSDKTFETANAYLWHYQNVHVLRLPSRGKGAAVRLGMLFATGDYCYMADCDLSAPIKEIQKFIDHMEFGADLAIGQRLGRDNAPLQRQLSSYAFHGLVSKLVPGIEDTQCGFKMFTNDAARDLFSLTKIDGLAFDVEVLYLAQQRGYTIGQCPVDWTHDDDSRVRVWGDSLDMVQDVLAIPYMHYKRAEIKLPV